jgi:AAA15 family ATPase/GTPase
MVQEFQMHADGTVNATSEEKEIVVPQFHHKDVERNIPFELHNESLGTQRLYALAGPILDILDSGKFLVFDELDSSLHTLLARMIVNIFNSNSNNKNNAQIIFSTHDTELLNKELLRRDQIWFVEKNQDHESTLYPLTEFSPRKKEDLEKGYLFGRYGAIPFIDKSIFHEVM